MAHTVFQPERPPILCYVPRADAQNSPRHNEALQNMKEWLALSVDTQNANDFMRKLTQRAKAAIAKFEV